jgi:arylsulfatase A-like enzyme
VSPPRREEGASPAARRGGESPLLTRRDVLLTAAWFGLAAGLLELFFLVVRVQLQEKGFFLRSRHFVWMVPASDLLIFLALGALWAMALPRTAGRPAHRLVLASFLFAAVLCQLLLVRGLHSITCVLLASGVAVQAAPRLQDRAEGLRRLVRRSLLILLGLVVVLGAAVFGRDARAKVWRRGAREAAADAPNVLLIVLDTVRADRLSLYGYDRETTPNLRRLAARGVRFDRARAAASWTLPSHANIFTARWPSELGVERRGWLDDEHPTLAEHLRDSGYATAGFVANPFFCGHESGLSRGFQVYADYPITPGEVVRSSSLGWMLARAALRIRAAADGWRTAGAVRDVDLDFSRKDAAAVNREFLDWVAKSSSDSRPFFAFLNFFDAHDPYLLPRGETPQFAPRGPSAHESAILRDWQKIDKKALSPEEIQAVRDAYDDCLAALDRRIGALMDALAERGVLDRTLLILTSDHGEQFGEHGDFGHGLGLHGEEVHVPLLMSLPGRVPEGLVVPEAVSLRDLPTTILDILDLAEESPFPGGSLASSWRAAAAAAASPQAISPPFSELRGPVDERDVREHADARKSLKAVVAEDHSYIRRGDGGEELYNLASDPGETSNQADDSAVADVLDACRAALDAVISTLESPAQSR